MSLLTKFLTFEYASEHVNEHDLTSKKLYSEPKIYDAKGDLSKRWYVYFSFRNPETGKLQRQTAIYAGVNKYKTKTARMEVLLAYRRGVSKLLKQGYNPYNDNEHLLKTGTPSENPEVANIIVKPKGITIADAFAQVLEIKKYVVAESTYLNYKSKIKKLELWLKDKLPAGATVDQISKKHIVTYLNEVLQRTSARTRNNARTELGSLFQTLVDNEHIPINYVHSINVLKARPERHKTYTTTQQKEIYAYLEKNDPILLLFIQFIGYNLLRPIEVCRLQVKDVDMKDKRLYVRAKNKPVKIKIIPDIMLELLPDLSQMDPQHFLFTPTAIAADWDATIINRRDHFSKRFTTVVKKHFGLGKEYGLYSFRHTFITKLYQEMAKTATPFEVKSKLMLITGHSSMVSLEKYLRDIDAALPEDYSDYFSGV